MYWMLVYIRNHNLIDGLNQTFFDKVFKKLDHEK